MRILYGILDIVGEYELSGGYEDFPQCPGMQLARKIIWC